MNAFETAQSLGITGDAATQHASLQSYGLTRQKIPLAELLFLLSDRQMMVRAVRPTDTGERWTGTLINLILYVNGNGTEAQASAVGKFFSHITNSRNVWFDTTNPEYSAPLQAMRDLLADEPGMPTSADFDAVVSLGGGYVCGTLETFAEQRIENEDRAFKESLERVADGVYGADVDRYNEVKDKIQRGILTTPEAVLAAMEG